MLTCDGVVDSAAKGLGRHQGCPNPVEHAAEGLGPDWRQEKTSAVCRPQRRQELRPCEPQEVTLGLVAHLHQRHVSEARVHERLHGADQGSHVRSTDDRVRDVLGPHELAGAGEARRARQLRR